VASSDAAWVSLPTPLSATTLAELCRDIEAVFRINPYYYFKSWHRTSQDAYAVEFENQSNTTSNTVNIRVSTVEAEGFTVSYDRGIKKRTVFTIETATQGSRLSITDDYESIPESERVQRLPEVDRSLQAWGEALRLYFLRQKRWSWLPGWRWYIRRLWIPMKPSARRIVWMIYLITAAEFIFFVLIILIWWSEHRG
jgi:hypothetical protein